MPSEKTRGCLWACGGFAVVVVIALILGVIGLRMTFKAFRQSASSMEPTLSKGDRVVIRRRAQTIERGDLIAFRTPRHGVFLKRVIGLPGDVVELRNSAAIVNGVALDEPYIMRTDDVPAIREMAALTVPPDSYFVLGDNRDNSNDSRFLGFVKREQILGKAVMVVTEERHVWYP
jgi:signal peptidase I